MKTRKLLLTLSVLAATLPFVTGTIFWRRGGSVFEQNSSVCHGTAATVNGRDGTLEVRLSKVGIDDAYAAASYGAPIGRRMPATGYLFVSSNGNNLEHRLVLPGSDDTPVCMTFTRSKNAPRNPEWPKSMPHFASGEPEFSAELSSTRASLVTIRSADASPQAAISEATAAFKASGWSPLPSCSGSFVMFAKGNGQAAIVAESDGAGGTRLTAVQRLGSRL